jgi:hypothetical protein
MHLSLNDPLLQTVPQNHVYILFPNMRVTCLANFTVLIWPPCVPFKFSLTWLTCSLPMTYCEAKLNGNGGKASSFFKLFWTGNLSNSFMQNNGTTLMLVLYSYNFEESVSSEVRYCELLISLSVTAHLHLVPRSRMHRDNSTLPYAFMLSTGTNTPLHVVFRGISFCRVLNFQNPDLPTKPTLQLQHGSDRTSWSDHISRRIVRQAVRS